MATVVNKITGQIMYGTVSEEVQLLPDEVLINKNPTEVLLNGYYNFEAEVFFENASNEERDVANKAKVPTSVSRRQLKQVLAIAGIPSANIEQAINQIPNELEKELMLIFWNDSTEFERNHPKLIEFSQALQMTETQVDELFIMASSL